ncbi:MotA/TolQ/ExbB proton channel family protein [Asaia lannensis]|uniref:Biopolymer transport protein ExbB n=1 Tax=Asaia lannensis NBRC 102526 TaxID=1307926 RepID=A0ABT1CDA6_9PROT|nr:MotA/TolQ/ExbB proton channel family protein [Asaia lannensis]MCO6158551.1 MotA/TolQ/ExbB proton channel family protein [Asaia lannensis NBRC 102526]GBR00867.1 ExbB/TolQ/MotA proton channel family protein [Asaia lannensis NBRC 102526]
MTRLFRLPALAAPALAVTLAVAQGVVVPAVALAQETPAAQQPAAPAPDAAAPAPAAPDAAAPAAPAPDAAAPGAAAPDAAAPAAPAPDAAPAPEAPAEATAPKSQENPYGLGALWANGDAIARGVLLIMVIMSAGTWIIMVTKFLEQSKVFAASKEAAREFWTKPTVQEGAAALKPASPFRYIAETGIVAAEHHEGSMRDAIDLHSWTAMSVQRSVDTINTRLQGGLAFLGTVGSTSPFVGLFGTVWGIYHALTAIGIAGQASIDKVAGPVGESLIMTAIGLATAVPAVLGYNLLVRRNKGAMDRVRNFAADVQSVLLGGFRHGVAPTPSADHSPTTTTTSSRVA